MAGLPPWRRTAGPYLLQQIDQDGSVASTRLVPSGVPVAGRAGAPAPEPAVVRVEPSPDPTPASPPGPADIADLVPVQRVERPRRPFPIRTFLGGVAVLGGTALSSSVALRRDSLCQLPDTNGDGFYDCPAGTQAMFWGGVGAAAAGVVTIAVGVGTEWRRPELALGPVGSRGWGGHVRIPLGVRRR